jgi:spore maturation protein CgeB
LTKEDARHLEAATGISSHLYLNLQSLNDPELKKDILEKTEVSLLGSALLFTEARDDSLKVPETGSEREGSGPAAENPLTRVVLEAEGGEPNLFVFKEGASFGAKIRLMSRDPRREDEALVRGFFRGQGASPPGLVVGFGLGWHLEALLRESQARGLAISELRVREPSLAILAAAFWARFQEILNFPGLKILGLGQDPENQAFAGEALVKPYALRLFPALYLPRRGAGFAKINRGLKKRRLLFFQSGYYLDPELRVCAEKLGYPKECWEIEDFRDRQKDRDQDYKRLLKKIGEFRPDLLITVNHLGFDGEGLLASVLKRLGIPAASWFVDSPSYILEGAALNPHPGLSAFSWDEDHVQSLKDLGFKSVHHLPLATEEAFFKAGGAPVAYFREAAFVGDSLESATKKYLALSGLDESRLKEIDRLAEIFLRDPTSLKPDGILRGVREFRALGAGEFNALSALVTWRASRIRRLEALGSVNPSILHVAGDSAWKKLLPRARVRGGIDYYHELCDFYRGTKINLNVTSAQMKGGMNQRVFDVPAAGAFLITDRKRQLFKFFQEGVNLVTYENPEELSELVRFYLARDAAREKIARKARDLILSRHLYRHRLPLLVEKSLEA